MTEEENPPVPNWLLKLEEQREKRLKSKLGHETGAGAKCQKCEDNCPGLDLHFWRKICKACKCGKEDHDITDDDIYGFVQFQLLGSKPVKSKGLYLKGQKDEVVLEWTPKGSSNDVKKYLAELPSDMIPVKGSQAAKIRKQMLQKQVPAHDIDASLCHALSENEIKELEEYVSHIRDHSVGQGKIIRLPLFKSNKHTLAIPNTQIVKEQTTAQIASSEIVNLHQSNIANDFCNLNIAEKHYYSPEKKDAKGMSNTYQPHCVMKPSSENLNCPQLQSFVHPLTTSNVERHQEQFENNNFNFDSLISVPKKQSDTGNQIKHPMKITSVKNIDENEEKMTQCPLDLESSNSISAIGKGKSQKVDKAASYQMPYFNDQTKINPIEVPQHMKSVGYIRDINYPVEENDVNFNSDELLQCHGCKEYFEDGSVAIAADRSTNLWHSKCFNCFSCKQPLADLLYFYHKETDNIYCGRDYALLRGIPRCKACDELIFVPEYCLAEENTFHIKHFCCFECDEPLAGKEYLMENNQPVCVACFESVKADKCTDCGFVIGPHQQGVSLHNFHWHATSDCFACKLCRKPLFGCKMLLRNNHLFCSDVCYKSY